ncbi:unnamed protein product [Mytilus coruscus]|uniref:Uncharacterized protein n=1 Tax=Mytilus coruscus TaxID=42192 RepID=A0A6J8CQ44_MYTCO|nr:unnamed protein product [Mytilus coruscus]
MDSETPTPLDESPDVSLQEILRAVKQQEDLNQVVWAIEHFKSDYARETVVEIADSSEGGWDTVRQYETYPVASDTVDKNKIIKAESRAIKNGKFKSSKKVSLLLMLIILLRMYLILQQNSYSSPFGNLMPVSLYNPTCPTRAEVSLNSNKESAMVVDLCNTGGIDAHSTQKQSASQKRNDFIKDEYLNISIDSQSSAHYLTHDYFEYEQGQEKNIKGRSKRQINFWYSIGYDFIIDTILHGYKIPFNTTLL